ncbi:MAG: HRDC domain-containing protein, partial [Acidimicrobiales bacterium]
LEYAAADVAHLLALYERLTERLEAAGRLAWAQAECAELVRRATAPRDLDEAWWRIKEARQLRGKSIGVAQVLAAWRERRAAEIDEPARFVLPDLALLSIAQRPPSDPEGLAQVRGLDGRHLRRGGEAAILEAVGEGLLLPSTQYRLPPAGDVDRDLRPAVTLASAWLSQLGRDLGIDTALLGTRSDLEALLRGDADARMANGWRRGLVGSAIARLVDGEAALAFDGHGGLVLEERSGRPFTPEVD